MAIVAVSQRTSDAEEKMSKRANSKMKRQQNTEECLDNRTGNIKNPMAHRGLIRKLLEKLNLRPGTMLYEEAESEAILAMVRATRQHDPKISQYNTYAGKSAYNAAISVIKKYHNTVISTPVYAQHIIESSRQYDRDKVLSTLYTCIDMLDDIDKQILYAVIDGKSLKEITSLVKLSYETVKMRYKSSLATLRNLVILHDYSGEVERFLDTT